MPHLSYGFIFRIYEGAPGGANFVNTRSLERPVRGIGVKLILANYLVPVHKVPIFAQFIGSINLW